MAAPPPNPWALPPPQQVPQAGPMPYAYPPPYFPPPPWAGPPPLYMPPMFAVAPPVPRDSTTGSLFTLAAIRDALIAFFVVVEGPFFLPFLLIPVPYTPVLALFPLVGMGAAAMAARRAYSQQGRDAIPVLGLVALAFSTFPGILVVGPFGLAFTAAALNSHRRFSRRPNAGVSAYPA